jgi:hypothetical protein
MASWWIERIPYILAILTCGASAFELLKKKKSDDEKPWFRIVSLVVLIAVAILSMITLHHERVKQAQDAAASIARAQTAKEDQNSNTAQFLQQFKDLSGQLADLKTQVKTDALQKKIDALQGDLAANERAMAPGPKASLIFTFWPFVNPPLGSDQHAQPNTDITLPVNSDGTVHIEFTFLNLTDVDALDGDVTLVICDRCSFAKEPEGVEKGTNENERLYPFTDFHALSNYGKRSVDVTVPANGGSLLIGTQYRCRTCDIPKALSNGLVRLKRDFLKHY